ncbi:MAG: hypothetical protein KME32_22635 [Mojavia pulchra JT2-VF2]|uniref:Uncharacterized protein n=1 Tax=Mojavia pulchra JT2-VF2 TaxID=287848 RepID=A0A951Q364_9NOST|nr:hypothetical protein [Mojavia pulchra JT2-VF2]
MSKELRHSAITTIEAVQTLIFMGAMPKAIKTKRCDGCSLYSHVEISLTPY